MGGQAIHIASLRPSTLAMFPSWGSSEGADRMRLARLIFAVAKVRIIFGSAKCFANFFAFFLSDVNNRDTCAAKLNVLIAIMCYIWHAS